LKEGIRDLSSSNLMEKDSRQRSSKEAKGAGVEGGREGRKE
jgi:hypothetical protein